jgi:acetyltransferase-like isoleucine patch superfamily enzyme
MIRRGVARGLRGLHRLGTVIRSRMRIVWLKARYPGFKTEGPVFISPGCDIIVGPGSTMWLRGTVLLRDVTLEANAGGTLDCGATRIGRGALIVARERIQLEPTAMIAEYVVIRDSFRPPDVPLGEQVYVSKPVVIGREARVSAHAIVLAGVTIGDDATIAAGAVVTKDVPAGATAVGVPARVIDASTEP